MTTRGGKRTGAGRKPAPTHMKRVNITLTNEQIDWLKKTGNASETLRKLIDTQIKPA